MDTLRKHYEPNIVVIAERFHFHQRCQGPEESIAKFLAELHRLATHCGFGGPLDDARRDRLVCSLEISIENDCLLWGMRVIVSAVFWEQLLAELHQDHPGVVKMKSIARSRTWWPGIDSVIEKVAKSCEACHEAKPQPLGLPWQWAHADYARPFMKKTSCL